MEGTHGTRLKNHNFVSEPANFSASDRLGKNFPAAQKKKPLID